MKEGLYTHGHSFNHGFFYAIGEEKIFPKSTEESEILDFIRMLGHSNILYLEMIQKGRTPQQARAVLPNALKTEVCMTGFMNDWEHFFKLRCDKAAHPQMRELAIPLQEKFKELGYV